MSKIRTMETEWKKIKYLKEPLAASPQHAKYKYELILPRPLADWDVFSYWEKDRITSMEKHLKKGDILFDVGAEQGWMSIVYANIVGAENIFLIEPTKEFWPNIKQTWIKNLDALPRGCFSGMASNRTNIKEPDCKVWPEEAEGNLTGARKYHHLHDNNETIDEIEIDILIDETGIKPDALTVDVEGAELLVLQGIRDCIKDRKPKIWVSIHPDLMEKYYHQSKQELLNFMDLFGYKAEHLATDHEEHWYFS